MFELYDSQQIEEMFDSPTGRGRSTKYPWYEMERGYSFTIPCDGYCKDYRGPDVPLKLREQGFAVTRTKLPAKSDGSYHIVITRVE